MARTLVGWTDAHYALDPNTNLALPNAAIDVQVLETGEAVTDLQTPPGYIGQPFPPNQARTDESGFYGFTVPEGTGPVRVRVAATATEAPGQWLTPAGQVLDNGPVRGELAKKLDVETASNTYLTQEDAAATLLTQDDAAATYAPIWAGQMVVYVDPASGSDANDGAQATPLATVNEAIRRAEEVAQRRDTSWVINLAAGTYSERVRFADLTSQNLAITIAGPDVGGHPNVPAVTFTEGPDAGAVAIQNRNRNLVLTVQDIKFVGYRGTTSSAGVASLTGSTSLINVHATQCFYGASSQNGVLDVKGGIYDDCGRLGDGTGSGAAVRSLMLNRHAIGTQSQGDLTAGPIIRNCNYGVYAQESSTGHVDWTTFEDNQDAVVLRVNSRANIDGSDFRRNLRAVRAGGNSHVYVSPNVTFGTGVDANDTPLVLGSGAETTSTDIISGLEVSQGTTERAVDITFPNQVIQATTGTLIKAWTLKAPLWRSDLTGVAVPRKLTFKVHGEMFGNASTKRINVRLGASVTNATYVASETGVFEFRGTVYFTGPATQRIVGETFRHLGPSVRRFSLASTEALTADTTFQLDAEVGNVADSIRIDVVELGWAG